MSQRVAFAGAWALGLRVTGRVLTTVRIIVLARLLTPVAFGLVGVALLAVELIERFTRLGVSAALIQRKEDIKDYLDTAWTMVVIRGLVLGGLLFSSAPFVAGLFNAPAARPVIQAMGIVLVLKSLTNNGIIYFQKELQVQKRFVLEMSMIVTDLAVSIPAALVLRNVWALVYGVIAGTIAGVIVSYVIHPYRPRLRLDFQKFKELFSYGMWVLSTDSAEYFLTKVDSIFVGRFMGIVSLGLYQMARRLSELIGNEVANVANSIAFPTYAKLQDSTAKLRYAFLSGTELIALVTFPIAAIVFVLAPEIANIVLGKQWALSAPAMRVLGIAAAIYSLLSTGGSLFYAIGKPKFNTFMILVASAVMVILLFPLSRILGLTGIAIAVLAGNTGGFLFLTWASTRILNIGVKDLLKPLVCPVVICLLLVITLMLAAHMVSLAGVGELILVLCAGALVYAASSLLLWRFFRAGPVRLLIALKGGR